eukprot:TRINITY_DN661_c0_g1_i1.p1 TRINITY_DN661_c0_g1~~TRINITY_DN661_c0_g1_i1.p1  ORF type:complete len:267 (+),score=34.73 TRINITY_DN661_c0_g1_i1:32-832(+)
MKVIRDQQYLPGSISKKTTLDLFLPSQPSSSALLVFVHGGSWTDRDKDQYAFVGESFASLGYATAVVDYTLSPKEISEVIHPVHIRDVAASIVWLKNHASEFGYDAKQLYFIGHSAGGFMAGQLSLQPEYLGDAVDSIRGWVSLQGIFDLVQLQADFPDYKGYFIDFAFGANQETWKLASPQHSCPSSYSKSPWLIFHSTEDELVNLLQSSNFGKKLQELDIPYELLAENRGKHFDVVNNLTKDSPITTTIIKFIQEVERASSKAK